MRIQVPTTDFEVSKVEKSRQAILDYRIMLNELSNGKTITRFIEII